MLPLIKNLRCAQTMATETDNLLKRKHVEMESTDNDTSSKDLYQESPPNKKLKQNKNEQNDEEKKTGHNDGNTVYGMTTRQQRKKERSGYDQKQRNIHRRRQKQERRKARKQQEWKSMTEEEKMERLDAKRKRRELEEKRKEEANAKTMYGSVHGMKICIDLSFNKIYKKDMEYTNVTKQLCYSWNANKSAKHAVAVHLLNVDEDWKKLLEKQGFYSWKGVHIHENKDILDVFNDHKDNIFYMTPDSENELTEKEFMENKNENIYILGGIVDRRIQKGLTLARANRLGIKHCKLPLNRLKDMSGRQCLNINAVFKMLLRFQDEDENWDDIMDQVIPNRNRQSAKPKKQRRGRIKKKGTDKQKAKDIKNNDNNNNNNNDNNNHNINNDDKNKNNKDRDKPLMFMPRSLHLKQAKQT